MSPLHHMPQGVAWLFGAVAALAAITDYRKGKIYNWLTFPAIVLGLALAAVGGGDSFVSALMGLGLAAALFLPLFFTGVVGGGDVKLLMALGTVLGARGTLELATACLLIAGLGAAVLLVVHRRVGVFFTQLGLFARSVFTPGLALQWPKLDRTIQAPFGIAIFWGFVYTLLQGAYR